MVCARLFHRCGAAATTAATVTLIAAGAAPAAHAAVSRIHEAISSQAVAALPGSANPIARAARDLGPMNGNQRIQGITMYFRPSAAQEAALQTLLKEQQTPGSPNYHKWLTPTQYAGQFGMSEGDLAQVTAWLEQQGFSVDGVSNSRNSITFSGTVAQVQAAFQTSLHNYQIHGETHYANSTALTIPAALSGVVMSVRNLNSFRPHSMMRPRKMTAAELADKVKAQFTSTGQGDHYMQPGDVAVIYDINAAYQAGYTGYGQSIAVVGQSAVQASDIAAFQSAAGLPANPPTMVLRPGSGTPQTVPGDESESDLDLEYSGAIAKDASVYFVYTGNGSNYNVFDSLKYAVDMDIAPIISMSYGECEPDLGASNYATLDAILQQAASQGQSVIVSAGDAGSTGCYADVTSTTQSSQITAQDTALAVDYPASSAYVTAVGGTEFSAADVASGSTTYWNSPTSSSDLVTSAKSYIPEQVWNDDSASSASSGAQYALSAGGGGTSTLAARPSWQTGVPGITTAPDYAKNMRLVPDVSLDSSPDNAGYLYCTSDQAAWDTTDGQAASCNNGFRDAQSGFVTVAGGTSFAAPIFAGMLAILNQKANSTGQGLINSTLYSLASSSGTYSTTFHDVTSGGNQCTAGAPYCSTAGASQYAATTGYDEASGLGSVDLNNLLTAWTAGTSTALADTTTSLTAASGTPAAGAADAIAITVASVSKTITTTPTGSVTIKVDGTAQPSIALSNGTASYSFSSAAAGSHVITATYSGNSAFAPSTGTVIVNVGGTSSAGSFTLTANPTTITASHGGSGSSALTITSQNSYAGTVDFKLLTNSTSLQQDGCYAITNTPVTANGTATATLTIYTTASACSSTAGSSSVKQKGALIRHFMPRGTGAQSSAPFSHSSTRYGLAALAGLFLVGSFRRRSRMLTGLQCLMVLGVFGMFVGCGGGSSSSSGSSTVPKGSYNVTLDGIDSNNSSIAASVALTVTVQ